MLTYYGIHVCSHFYILRGLFTKVTLTTEEVFTAPLKVISPPNNLIITTEEDDTTFFKSLSY